MTLRDIDSQDACSVSPAQQFSIWLLRGCTTAQAELVVREAAPSGSKPKTTATAQGYGLSPPGTFHVGEACLKDKRLAQAERQELKMRTAGSCPHKIAKPSKTVTELNPEKLNSTLLKK